MLISSPSRPSSARGPSTSASRRRARRALPVGDPHLGLRAGRCLADHLVHDLAQVHPVPEAVTAPAAPTTVTSAPMRDSRNVRGGVAVAVVADEVPAVPVGHHTPWFDRPHRVRLAARGPVRRHA